LIKIQSSQSFDKELPFCSSLPTLVFSSDSSSCHNSLKLQFPSITSVEGQNIFENAPQRFSLISHLLFLAELKTFHIQRYLSSHPR